MSKIQLTLFNIDIVEYLISYFKSNIAAYKLNELTNALCADIPSINDTHPLAMEYGNLLSAGENNYTSLLPAIGIEFISDSPSALNTLGRGYEVIEIDQAFHDAISSVDVKNRIRDGYIASDAALTELQDAIDDADPEKIYATSIRDINTVTVNISIWSNNVKVTRTMMYVVKSLLQRARLDLSSKGIKNMRINTTGSLYNYDFSETLFGVEYSLTDMTQSIVNIEIDTALSTIKNVEEVTKTGIPANKTYAGVTGVGVGQ